MFDFDEFRVITFDCYGSLIDWENGILGALQPIVRAHGRTIDDIKLLQMYGEIEPDLQYGSYRPYRQVLREVVAGIGLRLDFSPTLAEMEALPNSLTSWNPFPDTVAGLRRLKRRYKLGVISNIDDDLFAASEKKLQVPLDYVVTAQQARTYKPSLNNFHIALEKMGVTVQQVLHVAESLYHDVVPAKSLGISTVWVNRTTRRGAFGATRPADEQPDMQVPDVLSLAMLAVNDDEIENAAG